jgi:hypothetical protein
MAAKEKATRQRVHEDIRGFSQEQLKELRGY